MTPEAKEPTKINWTPIIVTGAAFGGVALIIWLLTRGEEARRQQAEEILKDWQSEFDELKSYTERIYAGGRIPTEQEVAILSSMLDQMKIKEETVQQLSKSVWGEFVDVIREAARNWWLVPVVVFTPIAGWATYKLVKGWFKNRRPPPNFPCPKCGKVFGTEGELQHHIETEHTPTTKFALEAQQQFAQTSAWVQNAVAVESYYANTFTRWDRWSLSEISKLSLSLASAWVYGIGSAAELGLLQTTVALLLI